MTIRKAPPMKNDSARVLRDIRKQSRARMRRRAQNKAKSFAYEAALISYLDILGMKHLLQKAGDDASQVAEILTVFRSFTEHREDQKEHWRTQFVNFSGLALRILPVLSDANVKYRMGAFFHEIHDLGMIQLNLIYRGILVRGAVVIGDICHQDGLTFGPGLALGYQMEAEAKFPRIIVSKEVLCATRDHAVLRAQGNTFVQEMGYLKGFLRKDVDGVWFLDYLALAESDCDSYAEYAQVLFRHKDLIEKQRAEIKALPKAQRKSRLDKLKWMIALHRYRLALYKPESFFQATGCTIHACNVSLWR